MSLGRGVVLKYVKEQETIKEEEEAFKEISHVIARSVNRKNYGPSLKPFVDRRKQVQKAEEVKEETVGDICKDYYENILLPKMNPKEETTCHPPPQIKGKGGVSLSSVIMPQIAKYSGRGLGVKDRDRFMIARGRGHGAISSRNNQFSESLNHSLAAITSSFDSSSDDSLYVTAISCQDSECFDSECCRSKTT